MQDSKHLKGADATSRALRRMGPAAAKRVEDALDKGAEEIRARAAMIVPRETGELAEAIEVRDNLDGFTGTGAVGGFARMVSGRAEGLVRHIGVFPDRAGSKGWYAAFVEFGTARRTSGQRYTTAAGITRKARKQHLFGGVDTHPGTPARPFLGPAFFSLRKRAQGRIGRAVNKAVKEVAARGR